MDVKDLSRYGRLLYEAEEKVLDAELELKFAIAQRDKIATLDIPNAMEEAGVTELVFRDSDGSPVRIEIDDVLSVRPVKANHDKIFAIVTKAGDGAMIKRTVAVPFNRGEKRQAEALMAQLQDMGRGFQETQKIESSTLKKWVRDRMEAGKHVDADLFGVFKVQRAKFSEGAPKSQGFEAPDQGQ